MRRMLIAAIVTFAATAAAHADKTLPRGIVEAGLNKAGCEVPIDEAYESLDMKPLGIGLTLAQVSCWKAAYNFGSILFAIDAGAPDKARLLSFPIWSGGKLSEAYSLTLPSFDPKTKTLKTYHKGRGVGDCGEAGLWHWTGMRFKLIGYWDKETCDGKLFEPAVKWRVYPRR